MGAPHPTGPPGWGVRGVLVSALPYLSNVFNKCFEYGIFPDALKNAKSIPINKAGQKDVAMSKYTPISLLSPVSKVLEKLLFCQTRKILYKEQHYNERAVWIS